MIHKFISLAVLLVGTASAHAVIIADAEYPYVFLGEGESHTVTHDLTGYGVADGLSVTAAVLRLAFSDGVLGEDWEYDIAQVSADGVSATYEVDGTHLWGFDIRLLWVGQDGIDTINNTGLLQVTVTALETPHWKGYNDFWWKTSELYAHAVRDVPEPGVLGLLGLGLLIIGWSRRRPLDR